MKAVVAILEDDTIASKAAYKASALPHGRRIYRTRRRSATMYSGGCEMNRKKGNYENM
jgi:hypothetical protein